MNLNFKEALATLSRGLPAVLFRAAVLAAGGFAIIIACGAVLFAYRASNGSAQAAILASATAVIVLAAGGTVIQRFFLFRIRAAMLIQFSDRRSIPPGLSSAIREATARFKGRSSWRLMNWQLSRALRFIAGRGDKPSSGMVAGAGRAPFSLLRGRLIGQAVVVLALSRNGTDSFLPLCEALALLAGHGSRSHRQSRNWLWFSAAGRCLIFLCLALPNWIIFSRAGAPVWIGIVLAAVISGLLHQAFVVPLVLAGVSAALLDETKGKTPASEVCEQLRPFFTP